MSEPKWQACSGGGYGGPWHIEVEHVFASGKDLGWRAAFWSGAEVRENADRVWGKSEEQAVKKAARAIDLMVRNNAGRVDSYLYNPEREK